MQTAYSAFANSACTKGMPEGLRYRVSTMLPVGLAARASGSPCIFSFGSVLLTTGCATSFRASMS